jgi:tetratricopeptide (TPR) repeat protein
LPEDDPKAENARLVALGKAAFADGEYGRAVGRFSQGVRIAPREPLAHFLLAEALFATGSYVESVEAIHRGLALQPDWPAMGLRPLQLYGGNIAEYPAHLGRLETALANNPNDAALLFLWAYQLWFDGRRHEAHEALEKARRAGADADDINLFLRALPPAPVL